MFALLDRCPHKGGPLSQGIVFGDSVACPLHNWTIGLADGCAQAPDVGCTPRFACKVEDGAVLLDAGRTGARWRSTWRRARLGPARRRQLRRMASARPGPPARTAASAAA